MKGQAITLPCVGALATILATAGCAPEKPESMTVAQAVQSVASEPAAPVAASFSPAADKSDAIAVIDGEPMSRSRLVDLLLEGHGAGLFEQLVVLDAARREANHRNIRIAAADIDAEYNRSLDALLGGSKVDGPEALRREAAETLLDQMLASRNASRREYMLVMERNAVLRALVEDDVTVGAEETRMEFNRRHGERVRVRHIQLGSMDDVLKVQQERFGGAEFGDLAVRYSANSGSADKLGELPVFTANDPGIPEAIRRAAFDLPPGKDSSPIQVDGWYHLIRVEERIPADKTDYEAVRGDVEASVRERATQEAMRRKYSDLFDRAKIEIHDPKLRDLFFSRYPKHGSNEP